MVKANFFEFLLVLVFIVFWRTSSTSYLPTGKLKDIEGLLGGLKRSH